MRRSTFAAILVCLAAAALSVSPLQLQAQTPEGAQARAPRRTGGVHGPASKELIYVLLPGTLEGSWDQNGHGIVVLDARNDYAFVKRIPTWEVPASQNGEQIAGVAASTVTQMIYVASRGRLAAIDLITEKKVWENRYDGNCCERPQVAPDGSYLYVGSDLKDYWYAVNPKTGDLIAKVEAPRSPGAHNLNLSPDGKLAFMSPNGKVMSIADTSTHKVVKTIEFQDNIRPFVLNHDASLIYTNLNNLLGFEIADVATGKILHRVEVEGFGWREKWFATPRPRIPHGCPSHGIALTQDESEVWVVDGINNYIHIYDNTVMPPKHVDSIKTEHGAYWLTVGIDGTLMYASSGDIIDIKSRKVIAKMRDEYGRQMYSEKLLDMIFEHGRLAQVANQFGNGIADAVSKRRQQ